MRKRQPLTDAMALSTEISAIETKIVTRQLTLQDAPVIDDLVDRVRGLESRKVLVAPQILQRVRGLQAVSRRLRDLAAKGLL